MRILLICHDSTLDRYHGAGLRTNNIWRELGGVADVSVLVMEPSDATVLDTTPHEGEVGRIRFDKPAVPWTTPGTLKIRRLVAQVAVPGRFDLIVVRYFRLAMLVRGSVAVPMVVDGDDLDKRASMIGKPFWCRSFDALKTEARRTVTRRALKGFAHVRYVNPLDMIKFPARSGSVLPNVTDAPLTLSPRSRHQPACVLMVGKFGYEPNAEAAEFFMREVLPGLRVAVPGLRFRLVGQCPPDMAARWRAVDGVEVAGYVDDLAAEYAHASVTVAPVFSGGGTQIKVLEALAYECGTVVSAFSAAGFAPNLLAGEHLLVARDAAEWVTHCLALIASPAQAERLDRAGRAIVLQKYSFDGMASEVKASLSRFREMRQ